MTDIDDALAAFEDATRRHQQTVPNLEAQAELTAIQLIATAALQFAPDATHMLIESSDQGDFMCAPHTLQRDGVDLLEIEDAGGKNRAQEWAALCDQYDLDAPASWLTWGHTWERFVDEDHPFTRRRAGYLAIDVRKVAVTL